MEGGQLLSNYLEQTLGCTLSNARRAEGEEAGKAKVPFEENGWSLDQKADLWKANDDIAVAWEERFAEAAWEALENDKREILAMLSRVPKAALRQKATLEWEAFTNSVEYYLSQAGPGPEAWRKVFAPLIKGVIGEQGNRWKALLGIQFDVENIFATQWYDSYMLIFSEQPLATTNRTIAAIGQQAMAEGWSVPTMQKRLTQTFQAWMDGNLAPEDFDWFTERMPPHRTEAIARTETLRASNAGSHRLYQEWGVKKKEWYSTADDRTREDHRVGAAWGQEPLVAEMGEAFSIGGARLMHPGDPSAPPEQVINCRCTELPVIEDEDVVGPVQGEGDAV